MFNNILKLSVVACAFSSSVYANTLKQDVNEVLSTNPIVQDKLKDFQIKQENLKIAESGYYPSVDLRASYGYNRAGEFKDGTTGSDFNNVVRESDYRNYETSITVTQNIFNGYATQSAVNFENSEILASAHKFMEVSNDTTFLTINAYLEVLKTHSLVSTAQKNVDINEEIYSKVKVLFDGGLTTESEVKKIQATLALSRSNFTVETSNATAAKYRYKKILGNMPDVSAMQKPIVNIEMPVNLEKARSYSMEHNPALLVSKHNIKAMESLYKKSKKDYYPTVDLEVSQAYNDHDEVGNGFNQADDRFRAMVVLNYNIFRGGADEANIQKHMTQIQKEMNLDDNLRRDINEGLDLAWNSYTMLETQLTDLREYSQYAKQTLELYKEEYDLGRRSLLDLLSAQSDVISSHAQITKAEYDILDASYRILDAMGLLITSINGDALEFKAKVKL